MKIHLLEASDFPADAVRRLRGIGTVLTAPAAETCDVEAVFVRLASRLDSEFHARYPALRWIVSPTTGLNHIDLDYFASRGVHVISLRGRTEFLKNIHATAEHTLALALSLIRNIPAAFDDVRQGNWNRYPHKGRELRGKTVLIYGYGRIGEQVAALFKAFGCRVLAHDIDPDRVPAALRCNLDEILPQVDILSVHLPLNPNTERAVGAAPLSRLPNRAVVINTSRGEIIDQNHLLAALESGSLAGAALDVLVSEPNPLSSSVRSRILALGNRLIVTPHISGFTHESLGVVEEFITDIFIDAVNAKG